MDVTSSSAGLIHTSCPCGGYGMKIHPAWADFYRAAAANQFTCQADYRAFWLARNCPTSHGGHLLLPPEEIACDCQASVAA